MIAAELARLETMLAKALALKVSDDIIAHLSERVSDARAVLQVTR